MTFIALKATEIASASPRNDVENYLTNNNNSLGRGGLRCNYMRGLVGFVMAPPSYVLLKAARISPDDGEIKSLKRRLHMVQEGAGVGAVDEAMIVGETKVGH